MTVMVDFERLQAFPVRGAEQAATLDELAGRINAAAWSGVMDAGRCTCSITNTANRLRSVVDDVRSALRVLLEMLRQALSDGWEADLFGSWADFVVVCAASAGLADRGQTTPTMRELLDRIDGIVVDREWMERQPVLVRRQWLALLSARWLPAANAAGAANCIDGVLHGFEDIGAITANSFASVVDAEILCDFAGGLHGALFPSDANPMNAASDRWMDFFRHQMALASKNERWTDASSVLWAKAEQQATELGYAWAGERNAHPSAPLTAMALLSEMYRWINRRHGKDSDPLASIAGHLASGSGIPASTVRRELAWLFDPHNHDFTYRGVIGVDAAVHGLVGPFGAPERVGVPQDWQNVVRVLPPEVRDWVAKTISETPVVPAQLFPAIAQTARDAFQSFSWAFTLDNNLREARCAMPPNQVFPTAECR